MVIQLDKMHKMKQARGVASGGSWMPGGSLKERIRDLGDTVRSLADLSHSDRRNCQNGVVRYTDVGRTSDTFT